MVVMTMLLALIAIVPTLVLAKMDLQEMVSIVQVSISTVMRDIVLVYRLY